MPIVATAAATAMLGLAAPTASATASATVSAAPVPLPRHVSENGVTGAGHHRAMALPAGHPAPIDRYRLGDRSDHGTRGDRADAGQVGAERPNRGVLGFLYGLDDHPENPENIRHRRHQGHGGHSSPGGRGSRGAQGSPVPPDVPAWTGVAGDDRLPFHHDVLVPHAPVDHLTVTVHHSGSSSANGTFELYCHPSNGSTHRDPKGACAKLDRMTKWGKDPFAPTPQSAQCTMIYGGPATARVTGTWAGRRVNAHFKRTNGCEVSRWNDFEPLLPTTTGSNPLS
nr:SSI family serine proteinase inhibitor [Streptomyces sp. NBRC 110611]